MIAETGNHPVEIDCHFLVIYMKFVVLSKWPYDTQAAVAYLIYIYRCDIDTYATENSVYVGLYTSGGEENVLFYVV